MADGSEPDVTRLMNARMSRRLLLRRSAAVAGVSMFGGVLAACGSSSSSRSSGSSSGGGGGLTGTLNQLNYPGWIGPHEVADFEKLYPGAKINQVTGGVSSNQSIVSTIAQNTSAYDLNLADVPTATQLSLGGFLADFDPSRVPNLKYVLPEIQKRYTLGIPTDLGNVGIAYRKDLVSEPLTSWADLWNLAPKYSGKIVVVDYDVEVVGMGLIHTGHSVNSGNAADYDDAKQALLELTPHVKAFIATNTIGPLVSNSGVAIAVDFNFDSAIGQTKNPNIEFVIPEEKTVGYLEGWTPVKDSKHEDLVYEIG